MDCPVQILVIGKHVCTLINQSPNTWQRMSPTWIVQKLFLVFRGYTETPAPGYDSMYDLALRGYDALHAVHGEYYEVSSSLMFQC